MKQKHTDHKARNGKVSKPDKAHGKAKPAQKHPVGASNVELSSMDRKGLDACTRKVLDGKEINPSVPDALVRMFLTNVNNGMGLPEAKEALRKSVEEAHKAKPTGKATPAKSPAAMAGKHNAPHNAPAPDAKPKAEPKPAPSVARADVPPQTPGIVAWITAATVGECPVDFFVETILSAAMKPFEYFFSSLKENEKAKKSDAALQKEWDRHFPGWTVAEVRREFNSRLSTFKAPGPVAKTLPDVFKAH